MTMRKILFSLLFAGAALFPAFASADSMPSTVGGILSPAYFTPFPGTNNQTSANFLANVYSEAYAPGSSSPYASAFSPTIAATDYIYAYVINNISPSTGEILHKFDVFSGTKIDAVATVDDNGGVGTSGWFTTGLISGAGGPHDDIQFQFFSNGIQAGQHSVVLLFATAGPAVLQDATLTDGASATSRVVSASGVSFFGTPLPTPGAAWGGLGLIGMLGGIRLFKRQAV